MGPNGVTVFCDPALAPAMRALGGLGPPVATLSAPAASMLAQLARHTRNDVLFTLSAAMDQAVSQNRVKLETRIDGYSNALVLAALAGRVTPPAGQGGVAALVAKMRVAVTDATPASGLDGRAVLAANALVPAALQGAANTLDVAFLVATGAADIGLVYMTDAMADPRLAVLATLQADPALTACSGAVNVKAMGPDAAAFMALMKTPVGARKLQAAGLSVPEPA